MHKLMISTWLLASNAALAHDGHGALPLHLHGWEIGLAVVTLVVLAGVILYRARK